MTCRDLDEILATSTGELPAEARDHLQSCGECRALVSATSGLQKKPAVDSAVLDRIRGTVADAATRVRPLAPAGVFMTLFLLIIAVVVAAGAKQFGLYGLQALTPVGRALVFPMLLGVAFLATYAAARDMRPGARTIRGSVLFVVAIVAIETIFFAIFRDYSMGRFVRWGMGCLRMGLACSIPAAILIWLLVRRGYVVSPVSTGIAVGLIGGVAGLTILELHCPILTIPHVAVWHAAVVVVSVGAGAAVGWLARTLRARRP